MKRSAIFGGLCALALAGWILEARADTGGPDRAGYGWADSDEPSVTYDWIDISATGTTVTLLDDDETPALPIGFDFEFYGTTYADLHIGSNGYVTFSPTPGTFYYAGQCPLPTADAGTAETPDLAIYGFYQDLNPTEATGAANLIYYETIGAAGSRQFVVTYDDVELFQWSPTTEPAPWGSDPVTFQIVLYEGSNEIQVNIHDPGVLAGLPRWSDNTSIGVENAAGDVGIGLCDWDPTHLIPADYAVRFQRSDGYELFPATQREIAAPGDTVTFDLELVNFSASAVTGDVAAVSAGGWTATPSAATVTAPASGGVGAFSVDVDVPATATGLDSDVVTVTFTVGTEVRDAELELSRAGHIELPPPQWVSRRPRRRAVIEEPADIDRTPIASSLAALGPVEIRQVRRTPAEALFNGLIETHHYLGYTQPVGEHLKYLVYAGEHPVACLSWGSAPPGISSTA